MILRDIAQTLTDAVTKCNRLIKYMKVIEGGHFIYGGVHNCCLTKWIYGGR